MSPCAVHYLALYLWKWVTAGVEFLSSFSLVLPLPCVFWRDGVLLSLAREGEPFTGPGLFIRSGREASTPTHMCPRVTKDGRRVPEWELGCLPAGGCWGVQGVGGLGVSCLALPRGNRTFLLGVLMCLDFSLSFGILLVMVRNRC